MTFQFDGFIECLISGIKYLPNTLILTFVPVFIALIVGTIIAIIRIFKVPILSQVLTVFITVYTGIPFVIAMMVYNLLFMLKFDYLAHALHWNIQMADVPTIWIGIFALSLSAICSMTEAIRGAFLSIDKGQYEAGHSVGLTMRQIMIRIIIPQVIPVAVPMLLNSLVGVLKGTSVVMTIGIMDVLNASLVPCQTTYSFLVGYVAAAIIYWVLTIVIEYFAKILRDKLNKHEKAIVSHSNTNEILKKFFIGSASFVKGKLQRSKG
ncbi:ABC transporter permease [Clostridia bacterium]|nr:ABC transporter permease [Clostridia bacterium]